MTARVPEASPRTDGRRARRHRSRDLAVDALLDLLDEGVTRPTAQQVAERSGVSLRSIFRIFDDVDTLHSEAARRQLERIRHLYVDVPASGTLAERIAEVVGVHDRLYAQAAKVRRAAIRGSIESPALAAQLELGRTWLRAEILRVFEPELGTDDQILDDPTLSALEVALSFEAWDQITTAQGLTGTARTAVTTRLVTAVFASA